MDGCPAGQRLEITRADQRAIVVEVGGRIRQYRVGARLSRVLTRVGAPGTGRAARRSCPGPAASPTAAIASTGPPSKWRHRAGGTQRHQRLLALAIASVASVFAFRSDSALEPRPGRSLQDKVAIANAKVIYARSRQLFAGRSPRGGHGTRFRVLRRLR